VADIDAAEAAFVKLLDDLATIEESELTWLEIATRLLKFCRRYAPSAARWGGLGIGEPWRTVLNVELSAAADLIAVDPAFFVQQPGGAPGKLVASSSLASREHVQALLSAAKDALSATPFVDTQMSVAVVARGLAGAIDNLAGSTYLSWFRSRGKVTIKEGEPYPVCNHDPRPLLGTHAANTNPAIKPKRDLSFTPSLRIATGPLAFTYVLDFTLWDRLSPLASTSNGLVMAAAQPNLNLLEFNTQSDATPSTPATWYANHGPPNTAQQVDRITRLIGVAMAQEAEVVLMPEYAASETVYNALEAALSASTAPLVFCIGISRPDNNNYVKNEAWLRVSTPGMSYSYSKHFHAKTSGAKLLGADERIRTASEIRVFISQKWSLSVLICVEVLAGEIVDQLAKIGTNLLLVPAMSESTTSMVADVSDLCQDSQAFVVMANGPGQWWAMPNPPCEALFAGPYASSPSSWTAPLPGQNRQLTQIASWVFRTSQRTVSLHQLPP
jgi:predicted amidohydrolase